MGEVAISLFKSLVKVGAILSMITAFIAVMTVVISTVMVALNRTVISDLLSMVQIWLPFNIDPIILWLGTSSSLYLTYRLSSEAYKVVKSVING